MALVLTDEVSLPLRVIRDLKSEGLNEEEAVVITQCGSLGGKLSFGDAFFGTVFVLLSKIDNLTDQWVSEISRVLKPGAQVLLQTLLVPDNQAKPSSQIERKLLISGFVDVQSTDGSQSVLVKGKKASWSTGSSFPLKKTAKVLPKIQLSDESDLIDEDSLLSEEDLKKPELPLVGDCEVGSTRKACKNCTCGRAEAEQKVEKLQLTAEQISNPQSACGNCGLGDAFRCGGCPYKGLPPFKLGEKVSFGGDFLAADI
ncbi:hypothetical protein LUZ62_018691 [Rhynchospora pubera]|uniref:Anamorsin homolog n=1 Tax=Rhynchospora pubera TaxID=906938 RepID=A0AAV8BNN7_9POAL|nr:hypothetical protein LUZ62_012747 [Rhynchospora pubera]KAJ4744706.1 hypothetical protein LUZ62_005042 [Rhynchospora pubera]KAJ4744758.1 hypothetical protein LUZ62_002213 [Rhynchospora pubera]KAJ4806125.1 hypothetical protein LUZ62_018691 [Rhynchospora pubera]